MPPKKKQAPPVKEVQSIGGLEVSKVSALTEPNSIMLFGQPKAGKSTLAGSISEVEGFDKVLHLDLERGAKAFAPLYPNVDVIEIPQGDIGALDDVIEDLVDHDCHGYKAVTIDTMSTAQMWLVNKIGSGRKLDFEGWATVADWTMQTMWDLHYMKALGISIYHVKFKENELTKELWTLPKIQGGAQDSVATVPDLNIHVRVVDKRRQAPVRLLDCIPKETSVSGNRFPQLPVLPIQGEMETLYEYIRGEITDEPEDVPTAAERAAEKGDED